MLIKNKEVELYTMSGKDVVALVLQSITFCELSVNCRENGINHSSHFSFDLNANVSINEFTGKFGR